jgi:hypothetical protein
MEESSKEAKDGTRTHADEASQHDETVLNPKALDILFQNLDETLKGVNASILLAFTVVAFLLIPGLEGTFSEEASEAAKVSIPFFNLSAELLTAAIFGLVLFWVFCFRAAVRVTQARKITNRLRKADDKVLYAALHFPSVATSTVKGKLLVCISLALLGACSWILMYSPKLGFGQAFAGSWAMVIPPAYLLIVLLWKPLSSSVEEA